MIVTGNFIGHLILKKIKNNVETYKQKHKGAQAWAFYCLPLLP